MDHDFCSLRGMHLNQRHCSYLLLLLVLLRIILLLWSGDALNSQLPSLYTTRCHTCAGLYRARKWPPRWWLYCRSWHSTWRPRTQAYGAMLRSCLRITCSQWCWTRQLIQKETAYDTVTVSEECLLSGNIQTHSAVSLETARRGLRKLISLKVWAGVEVKPKPLMGGEYGYFWGNTKVRSIYWGPGIMQIDWLRRYFCLPCLAI